MEGLTKDDLIEQRNQLQDEIQSLSAEEKKQSSLIHSTYAKKNKNKAALINAKNRLQMLNQMIVSCKKIKTKLN